MFVLNLEEEDVISMLSYLSGFKIGIIYIGNVMRKKNCIKQYEELMDENKKLKEEINMKDIIIDDMHFKL